MWWDHLIFTCYNIYDCPGDTGQAPEQKSNESFVSSLLYNLGSNVGCFDVYRCKVFIIHLDIGYG
jgi:hypothetical protein